MTQLKLDMLNLINIAMIEIIIINIQILRNVPLNIVYKMQEILIIIVNSLVLHILQNYKIISVLNYKLLGQ